jgi:hypothetical protein
VIKTDSSPIKNKTMKRIHFTCSFLLSVIVISSCVSSLYPISDNENDLIFREELLGHWADKDMKTQIIMTKADQKKYKVTVIDKKNKETGGKNILFSDTSYFSGFLVQLNSQYFFDCTTDTGHPQFDCLGEETRSGLLPLHFIYKIKITGKDELSVSGMDIDSMKKLIAGNRNKVKHENINEDHVLLTADAAGLQKYILTNKQAAFVFGKPGILNRKK